LCCCHLTVLKNKIEDRFIMPIIEPKHKLVKIRLEILSAYPMVHSDNCPLEQTPEVLDTHCVDIPIDEGLSVNDSLVLEPLGGFAITSQFVSNEHIGIKIDEGIEERGECIGFEVLDDLGYYISAALLEPHDNLLTRSATTSLAAGLLTTDVSIIGFNNTTEFVLKGSVPHSFANLLRHTPSCLVSNTEGSLKLFSGYSFLVVAHQPDSDKPLLERCSGAVEDRSCSNGELVSASGALPDFTFFDPVGVFRSTLRTNDTFGPTLAAKEDLTLVLGRESFLEFENIHA